MPGLGAVIDERRGRVLASIATALAALALVLVPAGPAAAQGATRQSDIPRLRAESWALVDADTGLYLAGKNPDERLPIASTTKVMLTLVALDEGVDLDHEVTLSEQAERFVGFTYSNIGLIKGERLTVRELLQAALIPSGTEAAYALAEYLGGGSVDRTVQKMNRKAQDMGLENTHFENPVGLDARGHYSSARDLATITRAAMKHPLFRQIVNTEEATISTNTRDIEVFNTNNLLYVDDAATGVKTGTSPAAGPCLVASAKEGDESYIAVLLHAAGEEYRFDAARTALEHGFDSYDHRSLVNQGETYGKLSVPFRPDESVGLAAARSVSGLAGPGLKVSRRITTKEPPPAARDGQELGTVELLVDGRSLGASPLVAKRGYEEASLWQKARFWTGSAVKSVGSWASEAVQGLSGWLDRRIGPGERAAE